MKLKNSGDKLKKLRETLGLNAVEMGQKIGVSGTSITKYENGISQKQPHSSTAKIISDFLNGKKEVEKFEVNHCYCIFDRVLRGGSALADTTAPDNSYVFRYVGKQGIHHCFREARGGWSRTYTDAQLIGKSIQEVEWK